MIKCEVCDKEFKKIQGLSTHIIHLSKRNDIDHPSTIKLYYDKYIKEFDTEGKCPTCNKDTSFRTLGSGYAKYCTNLKCRKYSKDVVLKREKTCIEKYGVNNPSKLDFVKERIKEKHRQNYGTDWALSSNIVIEKRRTTYINNFLDSLFNSDRLGETIKPLFKREDYTTGKDKKYEFLCSKCLKQFKSRIGDGELPICSNCNPRKYGKVQTELYEFCKKYFDDVIENDRNVLNGKEIDILIPSINLGIEFNGLYWHSELNGITKKYHINKTELAKYNGITLVHIFEDEWLFKQNIIKNILLNKFKVLRNKVYARKCNIDNNVINAVARSFMNDNHIQGYINGTHVGLFYNNDLVALMTIGKSRFNKKYDFELLRYCTVYDTTVIGGFTKLVKYVLNQYNIKSMISYVDIRFNSGNSYKYTNFKYTSQSPPSYFYINSKNKYLRESRYKYQKHKLKDKLETYDPNLTEWENMKLNNYDRIWDCGNNVYTYRNLNQ